MNEFVSTFQWKQKRTTNTPVFYDLSTTISNIKPIYAYNIQSQPGDVGRRVWRTSPVTIRTHTHRKCSFANGLGCLIRSQIELYNEAVSQHILFLGACAIRFIDHIVCIWWSSHGIVRTLLGESFLVCLLFFVSIYAKMWCCVVVSLCRCAHTT